MSSNPRLVLILMALSCLCCATSPAQAALKICNRTSYVLYTATGAASAASVATKGWMRVAPGACETIIQGDLTAAAYYVYARSSSAHSGPSRAWGGDTPICVKDTKFSDRDSRSAHDCVSDSYFKLPFAAIDTHHLKSWTMTLSEAAFITTLEQARVAGLKRLLRDNGYHIASLENGSDNQADRALEKFRRHQNISPKATDADIFMSLEAAARKVAAPAGYSICNDTAKPVAAAIGEKTDGNWISRGWWKIDSGSCANAITTALATSTIYLFVQRVGGEPLVTGDAKFCVADKSFNIEGRSHCNDHGQSEIGFAETRVQGMTGYAAHVGESGLIDPRHIATSK